MFLIFIRVFSLIQTVDSSPAHYDDSYWLSNAYYYNLYFRERDFLNPFWKGASSLSQPPVGYYILGLSLDLFNGRVVDSPQSIYEWERPSHGRICRMIRWRINEGNQHLLDFCHFIQKESQHSPQKNMLQQRDHIIGKRTSLFFGIASAFLLAYIGARFFKSLFAGLLAALIFLSNNITIPAFQQVLVDSMCVFFSLLTLIILAFLLDRIRESDRLIGPENKRALLLSVLLGFAMSLALGIKPVTLPVLAVFFSAFALSFVAAKRRADRLNLFASFTVAIISFCMVFILLFPTLWLEPLTQLGKMAQFRNNYMTIQNTVQEYPISSHQQRMDLIIGRGIFLDYELSDSTQIFYAFALLTGLYHASKKAVGELRTRGICGHFFVFLSWCIFTFLINGINQNMNWTRYYIPYVACASMMLALGVSRLSKLAHKKMKQYSPAFIRRLLFSHLI